MAIIADRIDEQGRTIRTVNNVAGTVAETHHDYRGRTVLVAVGASVDFILSAPDEDFLIEHAESAFDLLLTASFVAGASWEQQAFGFVTLLCRYIPGAAETANDVVIALEGSDNDSDWYQESSSAPTCTLREYTFRMQAGAGLADRFYIRIPVSYIKHLRVRAKEVGVAANFGTLLVKRVRGN